MKRKQAEDFIFTGEIRIPLKGEWYMSLSKGLIAGQLTQARVQDVKTLIVAKQLGFCAGVLIYRAIPHIETQVVIPAPTT